MFRIRPDDPRRRFDCTPRNQGALWSARARDWVNFQEPQLKPVYEILLDESAVRPGQKLLDCGCGGGLLAGIAASRGCHVACVDASRALIALARERVPNAEFREADMEVLPYLSSQFDVVTTVNSLQYATSPWEAVREMRRVRKPGGILALVLWGNEARCGHSQVLRALAEARPTRALEERSAFSLFRVDLLEAPVEREVSCEFAYPDMVRAVCALGSEGAAEATARFVGRRQMERILETALTQFRRADGSVRYSNVFRCLFERGRERSR